MRLEALPLHEWVGGARTTGQGGTGTSTDRGGAHALPVAAAAPAASS